MEGIRQEVSEAFAAVPRRGAETGGILLGTREGDRIVVEDFEPVPCEHRFGPSYRLSDTDREAMAESVEWFRSCSRPGLAVLGYYRSHTLPDFALSEEDEELLRAHFADPADIVLLIKPHRLAGAVADFFIRRNGHAEQASTPLPFPFTGAGVAAAALAWPAPRPRVVEEPERAPKKRWFWYIAATVLGVAGGAFGYLTLFPQTPELTPHPAPPPAVQTKAVPQAAQAAPAAQASTHPPALEQATPAAPPVPDYTGIYALLDQWSTALKGGDSQAVAACYAPLVSTYFARHDVPREAVRQSIRQSLARYGGLDLFRISALTITPAAGNRMVAVFLKHWQTSGRRKFSGEERERMTLALNQGVWQIVAEQPEKTHEKLREW